LIETIISHLIFDKTLPAGSQGLEDAVENRRLLEKEMTDSQIQKANELARNWKPKK
jgi:hypothetical protein